MSDLAAERGRSAGRRLSGFSESDQLAVLISIAHFVSTAARGFYEVPGTGIEEPERMRYANEFLNRLLGFAAALLKGSERYPLEVLFADLFRFASLGGIGLDELEGRIVRRSGA
jgi:hypothetical protein